MAAGLTWAAAAQAANQPVISGSDGQRFAAPPTFTITGDATGDTISWVLEGPGTDGVRNGSDAIGPLNLTLSTGPVGGATDGTYTLSATQSLALPPDAPPDTPPDVSEPEPRTFVLDRVGPEAPTIAGPPPLGNDRTPAFSWTEPATAVSYQWQIGDGAFQAAAGPGVTLASPLADGTYTFRVRAIDDLGNPGELSTPFAFEIDGTPPTVGAISHVPSPPAITGFIRTAAVTASLTAPSSDASGGIAHALSTSNTVAPASFSAAAFPRTLTLAPATPQGQVDIYLWARDAAGNVAASATPMRVVFDSVRPSTAPDVSFPKPGSTGFGTNAIADVAFSEQVQGNAVIRMCLDPCGAALPGSMGVTAGGQKAVLDPSAPLATGTRYEIELVSALDRAGNPITGVGTTNTSPWTFTTAADGIPPGPVTSLGAAAGLGQVALSWARPPDPDVGRITVLRAASPPASAGDPAAARFSLGATATAFTDVGLTPGVTYHYAVYTEDVAGNPSVLARSSAVPAGPRLKPAPPKLISARFMTPRRGTVLGTLRPLLRWRATRGAVLYNIQIVDLNTARKVVSAFPRLSRYRVTIRRLKPGHRYAWRVWAYRGRAKGYVRVPLTSWFDTGAKARR